MEGWELDPAQEGVLQDLAALGLTATEARLYRLLVAEGRPLTGYEAAKELGLSRANTYAALRRLERRGFVAQTTGGSRAPYQALPFDTIGARSVRALQERVARLDGALRQAPRESGTWVGDGWHVFLPEAEKLIRGSQRSLAVGAIARAVWPLAEPIRQAADRGLPMHFHCWNGCPPTGCGVCRAPATGASDDRLGATCVIVSDERSAVAVTATADRATVLVTTFPPVVMGLQALLVPASPVGHAQ